MKKSDEISLDNLPESVATYVKHLERVRSDFVANVSHELRTPLTVIKGYLEALLKQEQDDTKPWKKIFTQMYQHSLRMGTIIEDLLLLSHLESEDHPSKETNKIPIAEMLKNLCLDAENFSGNKKHVIHLKADKNVTLRGSETELLSLFSNIIINAVKYTPANGTITVEWYGNEKNQAVFKVTDTGIGLAEEDIPRITERFYRVDKARSRESGGTGLGLAIVKHVLLRHQSELVVESKLGKGSTFSCVFPAERVGVLKNLS